jgi:hypothetical protein
MFELNLVLLDMILIVSKSFEVRTFRLIGTCFDMSVFD